MSAPDRIYIDRGPRGGWMHRHERMPDTLHEYIRRDPTVLAALPEVKALIDAERERCAKVADEWQNETGTDIAAAARICPQIAAAIRAKGGEA